MQMEVPCYCRVVGLHIDDKKIFSLTFGKSPTNGSDDTTLTPKNGHFIIFNEQKKKLV